MSYYCSLNTKDSFPEDAVIKDIFGEDVFETVDFEDDDGFEKWCEETNFGFVDMYEIFGIDLSEYETIFSLNLDLTNKKHKNLYVQILNASEQQLRFILPNEKVIDSVEFVEMIESGSFEKLFGEIHSAGFVEVDP